ncbi:hypothetical protein BDC45DRAFT_135298 [Circinella umbellata]|nr:hypothetical protein BDC45DRAFT_135298 [Circinella umbellata]
MSATIVEFCTPPVPGETHKYYGSSHNNFIKLPHLTTKIEQIQQAPQVSSKAAPILQSSKQQQKRPIASSTLVKEVEQHRTLHSLAASGNLPVFKRLLVHLPDPLKAVNDPHPSTGLTPIHFAASRGHVDIVRCLVEDYHVSVDSRDKEGEVKISYLIFVENAHDILLLL